MYQILRFGSGCDSPLAEGVKLGFIGLGVMGRPMAHNLIKAGYQLVVFNRSAAAAEELKSVGAEVATSAAEVARRADIVLTMLPDSPDVRAAITGHQGVVEGLRAGQIVIDMSSISPTVTKEIAASLKALEVDMLDAPVSGGQEKAISGKLAFMVGGAPEIFEKCQPILSVMGASVTHVGDIGAGGVVKLANQAIVAINIAAIGEALSFAKKAGLEPGRVVEAIRNGLAGSSCLNDKAPRMMSGNYQPGFRLGLHAKDLRNVASTSREIHSSMPLCSKVTEIMEGLIAGGHEDLDHAALALFYQKLDGVTLEA